jgi:hypothetical protein
MRKIAERLAKIAGGWQPDEDEDNDGLEDDTEQDDEIY